MRIDHMKKGIAILGSGLTKGVDDITLIAEAQYSVNF